MAKISRQRTIEDADREVIKKELRELLILDKTRIDDLHILRVPGGMIYTAGSNSTFVPTTDTVALELKESKPKD